MANLRDQNLILHVDALSFVFDRGHEGKYPKRRDNNWHSKRNLIRQIKQDRDLLNDF